MSKPKVLVSSHEIDRGSFRQYVIGFILSLILTLTAYVLVINHALSKKWALALIIGALAIGQFITQITLFLHLGKETKPKYKLLVFGFMLSVVIILVAGSIWIMYSLNYRMTVPNSQMNQYLNKQNGGI